MRRKFLATITALIGLAGLVFACSPFVISLQPNAKAKANSDYEIGSVNLNKLEAGKPLITEIAGWPLIVLRPTEKQIESISELNDHVANPEIESYVKQHDLYVYWGVGKKGSYYCLAKHHSKAHPVAPNSKWKGGYATLPCDISYDYSGRAIKSHEYSYYGLGGDFENMKTPKKIAIADNVLRVMR